MARNMGDLILLDSVLRDSNATTHGHGALPEPGVPCSVSVDEDLSLQGVRIGLPIDYWEMSEMGVVPSVSCFAGCAVALMQTHIQRREHDRYHTEQSVSSPSSSPLLSYMQFMSCLNSRALAPC